MSAAPASPTPLAAPHTPIASAKRLRCKVPRSEPRSALKLSSPDLKPSPVEAREEEANHIGRKLSFKSKRPLEPPETPSKNLFSPTLRSDSTDHANRPGHGSGVSLHPFPTGVGKSDSVDSMEFANTPAEEIKQTSMLADDSSVEDQEMQHDVHATGSHHVQTEQDDDEDVDDDDGNAFNPYLFISELPPHETVVERGKICLPPQTGTDRGLKTLVLDLDETLVHCSVTPMPDPDLIFPVLFNGIVHQVYVRKRPYVDHFLEQVSKQFEVVLFTASQRVYADVLLDKLDPKRACIRHRLFREACLVVQGNYLKDLTVLGRDLRRTMLVDNSPYAYAYQTNNGIPIESWYDDPRDSELLKLLGFLRRVQSCEDVRPVIRDHFRTDYLVARARAGKSVPLTAPPF